MLLWQIPPNSLQRNYLRKMRSGSYSFNSAQRKNGTHRTFHACVSYMVLAWSAVSDEYTIKYFRIGLGKSHILCGLHHNQSPRGRKRNGYLWIRQGIQSKAQECG